MSSVASINSQGGLSRWAKRAGLAGWVLVLVIGLTACASSSKLSAEPGATTTGKASYYAGKFIGRPTASGEIYDGRAMTAAHRTLPFGTKVRVTRLETGASVVVRINDRGPFVRGRIIDLSEAAAEEINMIGPGVVTVRLEVVSDSSALTQKKPSSTNSDRRVSW